MLATIEKDALTQLRQLAELHQGGKPRRAQRYRELAEELVAGKIDSVIAALRAALTPHETALGQPLTETERRMGASATRLEHMDDAQELRFTLLLLAAVEGNNRVWGKEFEIREFDQFADIFAYVSRTASRLASHAEKLQWHQAAQFFVLEEPEQLLELIRSEPEVNVEMLSIVLARKVDLDKPVETK